MSRGQVGAEFTPTPERSNDSTSWVAGAVLEQCRSTDGPDDFRSGPGEAGPGHTSRGRCPQAFMLLAVATQVR